MNLTKFITAGDVRVNERKFTFFITPCYIKMLSLSNKQKIKRDNSLNRDQKMAYLSLKLFSAIIHNDIFYFKYYISHFTSKPKHRLSKREIKIL